LLRYALLRVVGAIPTLLLVILVAFAMVRLAPGGPFDSERALPPEIEANINRAYHLDDPLPLQFMRYMDGLLHGDLGPSYRYSDYTVAELIGAALPVSIRLGVMAMGFAILFGATLGMFAALYRNSFADRFVSGIAMLGISVPVFVVAPLLVLVFAVNLKWLPAGWSSTADVSRLLLPVTALALPQIAYVARITRASMIDALNSEFVLTATAQGLSRWTIVRLHALRPAMLPLVSYLGPAAVSILTGSVVVEQVFGIPGIGQLFIRAATNRDYTLVLGVVILYATMIILFNLAVDIAYRLLDPRISER
jgi:oligopeptide transport system permease protein